MYSQWVGPSCQNLSLRMVQNHIVIIICSSWYVMVSSDEPLSVVALPFVLPTLNPIHTTRYVMVLALRNVVSGCATVQFCRLLC